MEEIDVMYFHGKSVDGTRFTIAGVIKDDDLHLGIAICSNLDNFNKVKGRTMATGRVLNQRKTHKGRTFGSLYSDRMGSEEFKGQAGYPENYFVGREIKIFTSLVRNYNFFTKKELQEEFHLLNYHPSVKLYLKQ